jgi:hypothetical protein
MIVVFIDPIGVVIGIVDDLALRGVLCRSSVPSGMEVS